jgi:glycosyltransferase involved in cell wall biosynthesis
MDVTPTRAVSILYVITKSNWGGAQRYVYELAVEAHHRGHIVSVAIGAPGELVHRLQEAGITTFLIPGLSRDVRLGADIRALLGLISLIRKQRPQVVHANSSKAGFIAVLAARLLFVPTIIFTAHGWAWNELRPTWQKIAFRCLHFATVLLSHKVIAVSAAIARDAAWMPLCKGIFVTIRHGVAPLPLLPTADARRAIEEIAPARIPSHALWIGALAELHPTKGLDVLIRAFALLAPHVPEAVLVLIGTGQDRGRLTALAHMLRIEERVHFAGHIRDAACLLPALDIFVLPSYSEALGYVVLEAGQASRPVVASDVGGIPEIVTDNESGFLVPAGDEKVLAEKIVMLAHDSELRRHFGEALQNRVLTDFSRERMFDETFALYS